MSVTTWLVIALLIGLNALYVAAEFAAVSVRRSRIRQSAEEGNARAVRLLPFIENPQRLDHYIAASQVGITLSSLVLGAFGQANLAGELTPLFAGLGGMQVAAAQSASAVVVLIGLTVLQMVLGELVPKSVALQMPTQTALATITPMRWSLAAMSWLITVLNGSGTLILKWLGVSPAGHGHIHSPEEIDLLIGESREGGLLKPDEHRRLRRALQLGVRPARQLMVPRPRVVAVDVDTPTDEVLRHLAGTPYTRLPVYRGSIDNVVGMLHSKDLVIRHLEEGPAPNLEALMRPILIVHESVTADRLLTLMRDRRSHQAIVADEYGGVAGLVTLEDVMAEVLGAVGDEFKPAEPTPETLPDGRIRLPGPMRLDEAEPWIGILWEGEADTVGGRVTEELGHLPEPGERLEIDGVEVEVERVSNHAVASVLAAPLAQPEKEDE